jgi:hypothetical protein
MIPERKANTLTDTSSPLLISALKVFDFEKDAIAEPGFSTIEQFEPVFIEQVSQPGKSAASVTTDILEMMGPPPDIFIPGSHPDNIKETLIKSRIDIPVAISLIGYAYLKNNIESTDDPETVRTLKIPRMAKILFNLEKSGSSDELKDALRFKTISLTDNESDRHQLNRLSKIAGIYPEILNRQDYLTAPNFARLAIGIFNLRTGPANTEPSDPVMDLYLYESVCHRLNENAFDEANPENFRNRIQNSNYAGMYRTAIHVMLARYFLADSKTSLSARDNLVRISSELIKAQHSLFKFTDPEYLHSEFYVYLDSEISKLAKGLNPLIREAELPKL